MIDLTAASLLAWVKPLVMPTRVASPSPLTGGLLMVITATSPMTLYSAVMLLSSQVVAVSKKERAFYFSRF
jgi:hypothetical protein